MTAENNFIKLLEDIELSFFNKKFKFQEKLIKRALNLIDEKDYDKAELLLSRLDNLSHGYSPSIRRELCVILYSCYLSERDNNNFDKSLYYLQLFFKFHSSGLIDNLDYIYTKLILEFSSLIIQLKKSIDLDYLLGLIDLLKSNLSKKGLLIDLANFFLDSKETLFATEFLKKSLLLDIHNEDEEAFLFEKTINLFLDLNNFEQALLFTKKYLKIANDFLDNSHYISAILLYTKVIVRKKVFNNESYNLFNLISSLFDSDLIEDEVPDYYYSFLIKRLGLLETSLKNNNSNLLKSSFELKEVVLLKLEIMVLDNFEYEDDFFSSELLKFLIGYFTNDYSFSKKVILGILEDSDLNDIIHFYLLILLSKIYLKEKNYLQERKTLLTAFDFIPKNIDRDSFKLILELPILKDDSEFSLNSDLEAKVSNLITETLKNSNNNFISLSSIIKPSDLAYEIFNDSYFDNGNTLEIILDMLPKDISKANLVLDYLEILVSNNNYFSFIPLSAINVLKKYFSNQEITFGQLILIKIDYKFSLIEEYIKQKKFREVNYYVEDILNITEDNNIDYRREEAFLIWFKMSHKSKSILQSKALYNYIFNQKSTRAMFSCNNSGSCCTRFSVNITVQDVEQILKNNENVEIDDFVDIERGSYFFDYLDGKKIRNNNFENKLFFLKRDSRTDKCVFLKDNLCSINDYKPLTCKSWPMSINQSNRIIYSHDNFLDKYCNYSIKNEIDDQSTIKKLLKTKENNKLIHNIIWNNALKKVLSKESKLSKNELFELILNDYNDLNEQILFLFDSIKDYTKSLLNIDFLFTDLNKIEIITFNIVVGSHLLENFNSLYNFFENNHNFESKKLSKNTIEILFMDKYKFKLILFNEDNFIDVFNLTKVNLFRHNSFTQSKLKLPINLPESKVIYKKIIYLIDRIAKESLKDKNYNLFLQVISNLTFIKNIISKLFKDVNLINKINLMVEKYQDDIVRAKKYES